MTATAVVLFTADLRVHDHPPLRAALRAADEVVPLFVLDDGVRKAGFDAPNRMAFLADCLTALDAGLRDRGGRLVLRAGDVVEEVCRTVVQTGAAEVHVSAGSSGYAQRREARLRRALADLRVRLYVHDAVQTALPPGAVVPAGSARADHYAVFTPYHRRWAAERLRDCLPAPRRIPVPPGPGSLPLPERRAVAGVSPGAARGGEPEGRRLLTAWLRNGLADYAATADRLDDAATSGLSPHLHFGTLSPVETVARARKAGGAGAEAFVRQLCWRDFHHQVLAARPDAATADYRPRRDRWRTGPAADRDAEAWRQGRTGYPVIDAAMRQLAHDGRLPGRARLLTASFLTKTLYVDWRTGAAHFLSLLTDGDIAANQLNWQWTAGTGTDTRPNRVLNPRLQAKRHDPDGSYVRRWVPELTTLPAGVVHEPGGLAASLGYPDPVVDLAEGRDRFLRGRG
ncbi:cryptochrome/photolyase family protein [Streptomyces coryli]|uniref:cryptochrome/photolyase family protein n=1 Tax=Streptomyces coryli TaxID=1128680 RepID=UPI001F0F7341|nr:deoxyribodipyrimidine photo-lyase [Streptomyces coryli]